MITADKLNEYAIWHKPIHDFELNSYKITSEREIAHAIVYGHRVKVIDGTYNVTENNKHQCRSRKETKKLLVEIVSELLASGKKYISFEDIYSEVSLINVFGRHLTHLMAYDISLRIGSRNNILPHDFVYLHAGPLNGAKKLKEKYYPDLLIQPPRVETAKIKEVIPEFGDFTAYDIEHFLCIYHSTL